MIWTAQEVSFLKLNYHVICDEAIADSLNRSSSSVRMQAKRLGLAHGYKNKITTQSKISFINDIINQLLIDCEEHISEASRQLIVKASNNLYEAEKLIIKTNSMN